MFFTDSNPHPPDIDDNIFSVRPYLQLAHRRDQLLMSWTSRFGKRHWRVQVEDQYSGSWQNVNVSHAGNQTHRGRPMTKMTALLPARTDRVDPYYRLLFLGQEVFRSTYRSNRNGAESRIVIAGDFGDGDEIAARVASMVSAITPDLVVMPGDLVYEHGLVQEYLDYFFSTLNVAHRGHVFGVPLLRSTPLVAVAGNHDVGMPKQSEARDLNLFEDLFGFFYFWQGSGNSPRLRRKVVSKMLGKRKKAGLIFERYGKNFLNATNYCFDFQNQHWIVLDANKYMDWHLADLQDWLKKDLLEAKHADWRFVTYHQPPFNSDAKYGSDTRMRAISGILEDGGVDIVFSGHCHFYERTFPVRYTETSNSMTDKVNDCSTMFSDDCFTIDRSFDGALNRSPRGVIYIVTGAGGKLVSEELRPTVLGVSKFTKKIVDYVPSFTILEVCGRRLIVRQISDTGQEVDRFEIQK